MSFIKFLGEGELGGKARSLSFLYNLLLEENVFDDFAPHKILVPTTTVLKSSEFNKFIDNNHLYGMLQVRDDKVVVKKFLEARFDEKTKEYLESFLKETTAPIAVRSSAIGEDGEAHPLAGMFSTIMLPNSDISFKKRLKQLLDAVKMVYASVFYSEPTKQRQKLMAGAISEDEMAVILQEVVGNKYENFFYPSVSGVLQTYNFFPFPPASKDDGIALLAMGLGSTVVNGEGGFRVCPQHPRVSPYGFDLRDIYTMSQKQIWGIDLRKGGDLLQGDEYQMLSRINIKKMLNHKSLDLLASRIDTESQIVYDNYLSDGELFLSFNNLLKKNTVPFIPIVKRIMSVLKKGFSSDVDIEFAANIKKEKGKYLLEFYVLQARTQVFNLDASIVSLPEMSKKTVLSSKLAAGNGKLSTKYILFVNNSVVNPEKVSEQARLVRKLNDYARKNDLKYILVGPGRWGSSHKQQGIPVKYDSISNSLAIVEIHRGTPASPSQGSHFFHNVTSDAIHYLSVGADDQYLLPDFLEKYFTPLESYDDISLLELKQGSLDLFTDGRSSSAVLDLRETD